MVQRTLWQQDSKARSVDGDFDRVRGIRPSSVQRVTDRQLPYVRAEQGRSLVHGVDRELHRIRGRVLSTRILVTGQGGQLRYPHHRSQTWGRYNADCDGRGEFVRTAIITVLRLRIIRSSPWKRHDDCERDDHPNVERGS